MLFPNVFSLYAELSQPSPDSSFITARYENNIQNHAAMSVSFNPNRKFYVS